MTGAGDLAAAARIAEAEAFDPGREVAFYQHEAQASSGASSRAAPLLYEQAHVSEHDLGGEREATRLYTQSLTVDPSFAPTSWALRGQFLRGGLWEHLLRTLDAEIRCVAWLRPNDRGALHVERGRILEDRLRRDTEALAGYRTALEVCPDHPAALLALAVTALRTDSCGDLETALAGLLARTAEPVGRGLLAVALARLQRGPLSDAPPDAHNVTRASETLFSALAAGAAPHLVLEELDHVTSLSADGGLRLRCLDAFESCQGGGTGDEPEWAARRTHADAALSRLREKARLLTRRGARDAALGVLERALRSCPQHPLLLADFLDLAEQAARADVIAALLQGPLAALDGDALAEVLLRQAEIAEEMGALGEAVDALARVPKESTLRPLVSLCKLRLLARLGDHAGLSVALAAEAENLLAADRGGAAVAAAAHLLVRAAVAHHRGGGADGQAALDFCLRALDLLPGYAPATRQAAVLLAAAGRYGDLAAFLEQRAAEAQGGRCGLEAALLVLHRDILADGARAVRFASDLLADPDDEQARLLLADAAGFALALEPGSPDVAKTASDNFSELAARVRDKTVSAALHLLAARTAERGGDGDEQVEEMLFRAARDDPGSLAAAALEHRFLGRGLAGGSREAADRILRAELAEAEAKTAGETVRALRCRLAWTLLRAGDRAGAVAALAEARRSGDRLAWAWSLDIARRAGDADLEISLLHEPVADENAPAEASFERLLARAEALERAGRRPEAAAAFQSAAGLAADGDLHGRIDAELGLYRLQAADGDVAQEAAALRRLGDALDGAAGATVDREATLFALSAGLPPPAYDEFEARAGGDGFALWLQGLRSGDAALVLRGLERLAEGAADDDAAAELWCSLAARRAALGDRAAASSLGRAAAGRKPQPLLAVVASDLVDAADLPEQLLPVRRARAERLGRGSTAERALSEVLHLEEGIVAERAGRLADAADAYRRALAVRPESGEAVEGLRRIAHVIGDLRAEAAALIRQGALARSPRRASEAYAAAALRLEEQGADREAARLYQEVLLRAPDDDEAYHRLKSILGRRGDMAAVERLLSFRLARTAEAPRRAGLLAERARLRQTHLGDLKGAVNDFKRILKIDPEHPESLHALGRLAVETGHMQAAVTYLERAVASRGAHASPELRLELAQALADSGNQPAAVAALRTAAQAHPENRELLLRLVALGTKQRDWGLVREHLAALAALCEDGPEKADVLLRLGRFERDFGLDQRAAVTAFREALAAHPTGGAAADLAALATWPDATTPGDRAAIERVAASLREELWSGDPLDVSRLESFRHLAYLLGWTDAGEAVAQLLTALGHGAERGRAWSLARPLPEAALALLFEGGGADREQPAEELWRLVADAVARLEGKEPAGLGAVRQTRVAPGSEPRLAWLEGARVAIGIEHLALYLGGSDDFGVSPFDAPEPALVIGRGILAGDPASRFRVGRALLLVRQKAAVLDRLSSDDILDIFTAAALVAGGPPASREAAARAKALGKAMARREIKALKARAVLAAGEGLGAAAWRQRILRGAQRFGLLVAGDLAVALQLLTGEGAMRSENLRHPDCRDLIRFALGDSWAALKRDAGVAAG